MLDDLNALVEFAQAGSIAAAADRLFRTPSAITRQLQRLEAALVLSYSTAQRSRRDGTRWAPGCLSEREICCSGRRR